MKNYLLIALVMSGVAIYLVVKHERANDRFHDRGRSLTRQEYKVRVNRIEKTRWEKHADRHSLHWYGRECYR